MVVTLKELDQILHWMVAYKNRVIHRGGYTPLLLVFGNNPRLPQELVSNEAKDTVGLQTLDEEPRLRDAVSREQAQRARTLALETDAQARS